MWKVDQEHTGLGLVLLIKTKQCKLDWMLAFRLDLSL